MSVLIHFHDAALPAAKPQAVTVPAAATIAQLQRAMGARTAALTLDNGCTPSGDATVGDLLAAVGGDCLNVQVASEGKLGGCDCCFKGYIEQEKRKYANQLQNEIRNEMSGMYGY